MDCPNCHDANRDGDYEGPTCETCGGVGFVAPMEIEEIKERVSRMTWDRLRQWMNERMLNAQRIASTKTGADQSGWLEDMIYFAAVVGILDAARQSHRVQ